MSKAVKTLRLDMIKVNATKQGQFVQPYIKWNYDECCGIRFDIRVSLTPICLVVTLL